MISTGYETWLGKRIAAIKDMAMPKWKLTWIEFTYLRFFVIITAYPHKNWIIIKATAAMIFYTGLSDT